MNKFKIMLFFFGIVIDEELMCYFKECFLDDVINFSYILVIKLK